MALAYNPPVEHLVIFGPRDTAQTLISALSPVMEKRGKRPTFHIVQRREAIPPLLGRYGRAGVLLADSEEENKRCRDWLRERWTGPKIMRLSPDPAASSPFSYKDVCFPAPQTAEDFGHVAAWFGITQFSYEMEDPT